MEGTTIRGLLAANIKAARKRLKITQAQLAEKVGTSTSFIGEIEVCRKFPSPANLEGIASALCMEPYQLFCEEKNNHLDINKQILLPKVQEELKKTIKADIDNIIYKYMSK